MCQLQQMDLACKGYHTSGYETPFARDIILIYRRPDKPLPPLDNRVWGHYLKHTRTAIGMTAFDAAKKLKVNVSAVNGWESQRCCPLVRYIPWLLDFIGFVPMCRAPYQPTQGETLRAARELRGLTQIQLSNAAQLLSWHVVHAELNRSVPGFCYPRIEQVLKIPVREIWSNRR